MFDVLLEDVNVGLVACDREGAVTHANRSARNALGEVCEIGTPPSAWIERLRPSTPEGLALADADLPLVRALHQRPAPAFNLLFHTHRGKRLFHAAAQPLRGGRRPEILGAVMVLADVRQ